MTKKAPEELRAEAEELFAAHESSKAIAARLGCALADVRRWRKEGQSTAPRVRTPTRARESLHIVRVTDAGAAAAIAGWKRGGRAIGLTMGQFSLIDLIRAVLDRTGPADVVLSTWTTGIRDADAAAWLVSSGAIKSLSIVTDRSFPSRQPGYAKRLIELFGADAIVCCRTHAKFAVIHNDGWKVTIRSSMNLNKNPRYEQFDIDDNPEIASFFLDFARAVRSTMREGFEFENSEVAQSFEESFAAMTGGEMVAAKSAPPVLPGPTTARPPPVDLVEAAKERLGMSFALWAEDKSVQSEMVLGQMMAQMQNGEKINAAGLAAMFTRAREAREKVEAIRATTGGFKGSEEELREQMGLAMEEWPDSYLELAFRVYSDRHAGRVLFVSKSGHRAEYDADQQ